MFLQQQWPVLDVPPAAVACAVLSPRFLPVPHRAPHTWPLPQPPQPQGGDQVLLGSSRGCIRVFYKPCRWYQASVSFQEVWGRVGGCRVVASCCRSGPYTRLLTLPGCVGQVGQHSPASRMCIYIGPAIKLSQISESVAVKTFFSS